MSTYRVLDSEDILAFPPISWLAHSLIPDQSLAVLYGPPKIGKSFVALDLAWAMGSSERWLGKRVRHGPVVYVIGEGARGIKKRLQGWSQAHGGIIPKDIFYISEPVFLHQQPHVRKLLKTIIPLKPALVVVDTLARSMAGANENAVEAMGLVVSAADEIRARTGAAVLFVHHTRHPDEEGNHNHRPRGSSALIGAVDVLLELDGDPEQSARTLRNRYQKDDEPCHPIDLVLRPVRRAGKTISLVPVAGACQRFACRRYSQVPP